MKDISDYIKFNEDGRLPKKSIKSIINVPLVIRKWNVFESKYRDGNPSGKFVQMLVDIDDGSFLVNTGSEIIMEELDAIKQAKEDAGETEMDFTCVIKRFGRGVKMFPMNWSRKDDGQEKREESE